MVVDHATIALGIAVFWTVGAIIAGNTGAIDPWFYAASPFVFFQWDWLVSNLGGMPDPSATIDILRVVATTRAGASAVLWPVALLGTGLAPAQVSEAGVGLLLVAVLVCADLLPTSVPRWAAVAVGVGGIGVYNAIAILSGGQLQQAAALLMVLACIWLARASALPAPAIIVFVISGYVLSGSYPEFLIILPMYSAVLVLIVRQTPRATAAQVGGLLAGFAFEQLVTGGASITYLLGQSTAAPGWSPLPNPPGAPYQVLLDVILETRPPLVTLPVVALAGGLFWASWRGTGNLAALPWHAVVLLGAGCLVWIFALERSQKLDYAVFKLGGWLGPGLLLFAFWVNETLCKYKLRLAQTSIMIFAVARAASLVYGGNEVMGLGRADLAQLSLREALPEGGCVVRIDTSEPVLAVAAIAASAAPFHSCSLAQKN
jgi:hypothetical protein